MLVQFGVHFELPNRSKSDSENKLFFKRFRPPPGNRGDGLRGGNMACFGPGGGLNWGGKPVSSYQCIKVSRIQRQLVSIYQYNKDTWRQEATILRFSSILPKAAPQPGDPHKGGRRITGSASDACLKAERCSIEPGRRYTRRVSNVFRGFTP